MFNEVKDGLDDSIEEMMMMSVNKLKKIVELASEAEVVTRSNDVVKLFEVIIEQSWLTLAGESPGWSVYWDNE
jgi:hypothetical protein